MQKAGKELEVVCDYLGEVEAKKAVDSTEVARCELGAMITQEQVRHIFKYDADTGHLFYSRPGFRVRVGMRAGWLDNGGYRRIKINKRSYLEHVVVWVYVNGEYHSGEIDHINHVRDDNRIENLRVVTKTQNGRNQKISKRSTSGFCGVYWCKRRKLWLSQIRVDGKLKSLGYFENKENAISARVEANKKYGFHEFHGK